MSIIQELWYGNITPADQCGKNNGEIRELLSLMERHRETLAQALAPAQQDTLGKYMDCMEEYTLLLTEEAFAEGFRLGGRFFAEALLEG